MSQEFHAFVYTSAPLSVNSRDFGSFLALNKEAFSRGGHELNGMFGELFLELLFIRNWRGLAVKDPHESKPGKTAPDWAVYWHCHHRVASLASGGA